MTTPHPDWESLPAEILHAIFQFAPEQQLCSLDLVCKTWSRTAKVLLYSHVFIKTISQLENFHNTVEHNYHLGEKVKIFEIEKHFIFALDPNVRAAAKEKMFNIFTTLFSTHLPNLEAIKESALHTYVPVLDALLESRLKRLNTLLEPSYRVEKGEVANYITCALLMKNRLKNLLLSDNYIDSEGPIAEQLTFTRLYRELHQFERLEKINIQRLTNEGIQMLDDITEQCKTLKEISFYFTPSDKEAPLNNTISVESIVDFTPRSNIKILTSQFNNYIDKKFLLYIMHKFPRLEKLCISMTDNLRPKLNQSLLTQLLYYLSKIKDFSASGLIVEHHILTKSIGDFWDSTSNLGSKYVKFCYSEALSVEWLGLTNESTNLGYVSSNPEWKHIDFLEKNGKYLKGIHFDIAMHNHYTSERCVFPKDFVDHTFTYCPLLQYLKLEKCTLKNSVVHMSAKLTLEELVFINCKISAGVLEQLSLTLCRVKRLEVFDCRFDCRFITEKEEKIWLKADEIVAMPHTKIDVIVIGIFFNESRFIKVFLPGEARSYYFHIRHDDKCARVSSEQKYTNAEPYERTYICCQNIPIFEAELIE